ncbi:MAG: exonuclease [Bacteroidetes bacterium]|nr:MAG: exonuclease [Bacteroidota bacterium]
MRIITWNCNMAFRKKALSILDYNPDIVVVPECEHPDKLIFEEKVPRPNDCVWFGKNQNKGLAILSYSDFKFKVMRGHDENLRMIVPLTVKNDQLQFNLLAIWANNPGDKDGQYITQVWKAIHKYNRLLSRPQTILIGDFNSNKIWDRPRRVGNHTHVVDHLMKKKIQSLYHLHFNQNQGEEMHPTFYLYKQKEKPYHLDYCFASSDLANRLSGIEVGTYDQWIKYSDHVPMIFTFDLNKTN